MAEPIKITPDQEYIMARHSKMVGKVLDLIEASMPEGNQCEKMKKLILTIIVAAVFSTGCVTKTGTGALGGGALGALAGQAIGGDTKATLIGGAIGAAVGGAIGNQEDAKDGNKK